MKNASILTQITLGEYKDSRYKEHLRNAEFSASEMTAFAKTNGSNICKGDVL